MVMDEFHYYGDRERGVAWQMPLLTLPDEPPFLLMSATLGDTTAIEQKLQRPHRPEVVAVRRRRERPGAARVRVPRDAAARDAAATCVGAARRRSTWSTSPSAPRPSRRRALTSINVTTSEEQKEPSARR